MGARPASARAPSLLASVYRLECRLPLMANTPLGHCTCAPQAVSTLQKGPTATQLPQRRSRSKHVDPALCIVAQRTMARGTTNEAAASSYGEWWLVVRPTRLPDRSRPSPSVRHSRRIAPATLESSARRLAATSASALVSRSAPSLPSLAHSAMPHSLAPTATPTPAQNLTLELTERTALPAYRSHGFTGRGTR